MDIDESSDSEFMELFSESSDDIDELIDTMNEQINDQYDKIKYLNAKRTELYFSFLKQKEEIEQLKKVIDNMKSVISSNLPPYLNAVVEFL